MIRTDDDQVYTGITTDMERRWREHAQGKAGARYFRGRSPRQLCLLEPHPDRSSASKREASIKQLKRADKEALIEQQSTQAHTALAKWQQCLNPSHTPEPQPPTTKPASEKKPKRAHCTRCHRPANQCICQWICPTHNHVELVILQHPMEVKNAKNTAGLLHLSLAQCQMHIGEQFDEQWLAKLLASENKTNLLLYPPTSETESLGLTEPAPLPDLDAIPSSQVRLILLDATWRKSRKQLYLNPLLQKLPRLALTNCPPSTYRIRKAQAPDQLSSLEAACAGLRQLEQKRVDYAPLLTAFAGFVTQHLAFRPEAQT